MTDVMIIGAGPAGLSAAIYAARAGVSARVFERGLYGGQASFTSEVDNYPSRPHMEGATFASDLYAHATACGAEVVFEEVTAVKLEGEIKKITTSGKVYEGRAVIVAAGAKRRQLDVPGEAAFTGRGVSYCATCDAAFFKDKTVVIAGGGNTAFGDALFLSNHCRKVYLVHRREGFRAEKIRQVAVRARENVEIIAPATIAEIQGDDVVERVVLDTPGGRCTLEADGVFVAIGLVPDTRLYAGRLPLDANGYFEVGESCVTPVRGVYVAGDCRQKSLRQIVTAAADGAVAAVAAAEYCNALDEKLPCALVADA